MNIEGLGVALVEQLLKKKIIKNIPDIYRLSHEDLANLERMGSKSAQNVLDEIEKSKKRERSRLIFALGIRFVGERMAQILASHYKSLNSLSQASYDDLIQVEGVGPKVAESLIFFFKQPENIELLSELKAAGLTFTVEDDEKGEKPLAGQTFVLTGKLEALSREEAAEIIEKMGGKISSSVSKKTSYVIVGEAPGSKLAKAQELGIPTMDEEELLKIIGR